MWKVFPLAVTPRNSTDNPSTAYFSGRLSGSQCVPSDPTIPWNPPSRFTYVTVPRAETDSLESSSRQPASASAAGMRNRMKRRGEGNRVEENRNIVLPPGRRHSIIANSGAAREEQQLNAT
jgi:hypothetical protein